jgi:Putative beta-barrel porin 2
MNILNIRRFSPALAGFVLATFAAIGSLGAQQSQVPSSFLSPPAPSSNFVDNGSGSGGQGAGSGSNLNPIGMFESSPFTYLLTVNEGYNSNFYAVHDNPTQTLFTSLQAQVNYKFGGPRLQLNSSLNAGVTYNYNISQGVQYNGRFTLAAVYLLTPRLTISGNTAIGFQPQQNGGGANFANQFTGSMFYTNTSLQAAYQWSEKFSTVTSYSGTVNYYFDQQGNKQQGANNQSFWQSTITQSFNWLLLPKTTITAQYLGTPTIFGNSGLNNFGNGVQVGFTQVFNPRFKWTLLGGCQVNSNPARVLPTGQTNLSYQFGPASTLTWNAQLGTQASSISGVGVTPTFSSGLAISHAFTSRISANLGFNFQEMFYQNQPGTSSFNQTTFNVTLGANYRINSHISLTASYQYTDVIAPGNVTYAYAQSIPFIGANLSF